MTSVSTLESYAGPERRRHRLYVTRNSEYHTRDGICVAVRNLRTGSFASSHKALGKRVTAGLRFGPHGGLASICPADEAEVGLQLCFTSSQAGPEREVVTSEVEAIERPPKDVVNRYP